MNNYKYMNKLISNSVYLAVLFSVMIGILLSISFRPIKYTEFIDPKISDISPKDAYSNILRNPESVILIDVRSEEEYFKAHATSAVNLPIHFMYDDTHGLKNEKKIPLPKNNNQEIYLICSGGRLAGVAYSYLEHYGYRNIKRIEHGLSGWNDASLPIVTPDIFRALKKSGDSVRSAPLDRPYEIRR